jgi:hypothetical protein
VDPASSAFLARILSRENDHGVPALLPLRFRHGAPDNAVHKGQQWLKHGAILVTCGSVNVTFLEETNRVTPHSLGIGRHGARWRGRRG